MHDDVDIDVIHYCLTKSNLSEIKLAFVDAYPRVSELLTSRSYARSIGSVIFICRTIKKKEYLIIIVELLTNLVFY